MWRWAYVHHLLNAEFPQNLWEKIEDKAVWNTWFSGIFICIKLICCAAPCLSFDDTVKLAPKPKSLRNHDTNNFLHIVWLASWSLNNKVEDANGQGWASMENSWGEEGNNSLKNLCCWAAGTLSPGMRIFYQTWECVFGSFSFHRHLDSPAEVPCPTSCPVVHFMGCGVG